MGIGDWGLGIGDWAQSTIPNPQSPIPNPQCIVFILHLKNIYDSNFLKNKNKIVMLQLQIYMCNLYINLS